jgi:hypothetical protein
VIKLGEEVRLSHLFSATFKAALHSDQVHERIQQRCVDAFGSSTLKMELRTSLVRYFDDRPRQLPESEYGEFMDKYLVQENPLRRTP